MFTDHNLYKRHRYPKEIIKFAVLSYYRFSLSFRDVEEMLAYRGIAVSYEGIRGWVNKYGIRYSRVIRKKLIATDKWHMDEVRYKINGQVYWVWRVIDSKGNDLDVLVQERRNAKVAKRLFKKLLKKHKIPRVLVTDKLKSYPKEYREIFNHGTVELRCHKGLNNRIEQSHQYLRKREKPMLKFKSKGHAQKFLSISSQINNLFRCKRHKIPRISFKLNLQQSIQTFFHNITEFQAA